MNKKQLAIGDRVRLYGFSEHRNGIQFLCESTNAIVKNIVEGDLVEVVIQSETYRFHESQVRKLKPKPRREIWLNEYKDGSLCTTFVFKNRSDANAAALDDHMAYSRCFREAIEKPSNPDPYIYDEKKK